MLRESKQDWRVGTSFGSKEGVVAIGQNKMNKEQGEDRVEDNS